MRTIVRRKPDLAARRKRRPQLRTNQPARQGAASLIRAKGARLEPRRKETGERRKPGAAAREEIRKTPTAYQPVDSACKEPSDSVKESQRALSIPFRPIMRSAQHFAIGFVRIAAFAPCGNMIGVHFVEAIDSGLIAIVACGADRAV